MNSGVFCVTCVLSYSFSFILLIKISFIYQEIENWYISSKLLNSLIAKNIKVAKFDNGRYKLLLLSILSSVIFALLIWIVASSDNFLLSSKLKINPSLSNNSSLLTDNLFNISSSVLCIVSFNWNFFCKILFFSLSSPGDSSLTMTLNNCSVKPSLFTVKFIIEILPYNSGLNIGFVRYEIK